MLLIKITGFIGDARPAAIRHGFPQAVRFREPRNTCIQFWCHSDALLALPFKLPAA